MAQIPFNGKDRTCPICGKVFLLYEETWVYKRRPNQKPTEYFCSWGCMQKWDQLHPRKMAIEQRDEIIHLIEQGKGISEIVRTTGADRSKVRYWMDRVPKGESKSGPVES